MDFDEFLARKNQSPDDTATAVTPPAQGTMADAFGKWTQEKDAKRSQQAALLSEGFAGRGFDEIAAAKEMARATRDQGGPDLPPTFFLNSELQRTIEMRQAQTAFEKAPDNLVRWSLEDPMNAVLAKGDMQNLSVMGDLFSSAAFTVKSVGVQTLPNLRFKAAVNQMGAAEQNVLDRERSFFDILDEEVRQIADVEAGPALSTQLLKSFTGVDLSETLPENNTWAFLQAMGTAITAPGDALGRYLRSRGTPEGGDDARIEELRSTALRRLTVLQQKSAELQDERGRHAAYVRIAPKLSAVGESNMTPGQQMAETLRIMADDPSGAAMYLASTTAESLPGLLLAGLGAYVGINPVATLGATSYLRAETQSFEQVAKDRGYDLGKPDDVLRMFQDPEALYDITDASGRYSATVAFFDAVSGAAAGQALAKTPMGDVLIQGIAQGAFGGLGEAAAQLASGQDVNGVDVLMEILAEFTTAPVEVAAIGGRKLGQVSGAEKALTDMRDRRREKGRTDNERAFFDALSKGGETSELKKKSPAAFRDAVASMTKDGPVETVYADAEAVDELLQSGKINPAEFEQVTGISPDEVSRQASVGGDIQISTADYAAKVVGTPLADALRDHTRLQPDTLSAAEFKAMQDADTQGEAEALAAAVTTGEEAFAPEVEAARARMVEQLRGAGRAAAEAEQAALLFAAQAQTTAAVLGIEPAAYLRRFPIPEVRTGVAPAPSPAPLDQTSAPFQQWFGGSVVNDGAGGPRQVYHGAVGDFDAFRPGRFAWVSSTPELANTYAENRREGMLRGNIPYGPVTVMPLYARVTRPFDTATIPARLTVDDLIAALRAAGEPVDPAAAEAAEAAMRAFDTGRPQGIAMFWQNGEEGDRALIDLLTAYGYDAIRHTERGSETFGVFDPAQLKSPFNRGSFDPTDARLLYQPAETFRLPDLEKASPGPVPGVREVATRYMQAQGLPVRHQASYVKVDVERAREIARLYDEMEDAPNDPQVRAAYTALARETIQQYEALLELGFTFEWITGEDPYASPREAILDMQQNRHLWVFPTTEGFGTVNEATSDHPLLQPTEHEIDGRVALVNDLFRIVHDVFGHGSEGAAFGARGEENAWQAHVRMFSPLAARAMTSETRGQNSWVNFGPYGEQNRANPANTVFADQKVGLLPEWVSAVGQAEDRPLAEVMGWPRLAEFEALTPELLQRDGWYIITGMKEGNGDKDAPANVAANAALRAALDARGLEYMPVSGMYKGEPQGESYLVVGDTAEGLALGRAFGQESILTFRGLEYGDGRPDTPQLPAETVVGPAALESDFYSVMPDGTPWTMGLDWGSDELFQSAPAVESPAFKAWFGNSAVVDESGAPLVVYHGTTGAAIEAFDPERKGVTTMLFSAVETHRQGFYFAEKEGFARGFAEQGGRRGTGTVMPVYLSIQNPLDVTSDDNASVERLRAVIARAQEIDPEINNPDFLLRPGDDSFWETLDTAEGGDVFVQAMRDLGYDGIKMIEPDLETSDPNYETDDTGAVTWVAFEPTQIKSVNNRGTFDPSDARVLYQSAPARMYYSPLLEGVRGAKQAKAKGKDWLAILPKLPGVKEAELVFTGTLDWLETLREDTVTREEVVAHIERNQIDVVELEGGRAVGRVIPGPGHMIGTRTGVEPATADEIAVLRTQAALEGWSAEELDEDNERTPPLAREFRFLGEGEPVRVVSAHAYHLDTSTGAVFEYLDDLLSTLARAHAERAPDRRENKWVQYTEAGATNYREFLLTIPNLNTLPVNEGTRPFVNDLHYSDPNIVVTARTTDRTISGKRALFAEEVQSDLSSDNRKAGQSWKNRDGKAGPSEEEIAAARTAYNQARRAFIDAYDAQTLGRYTGQQVSEFADFAARAGTATRLNQPMPQMTPILSDMAGDLTGEARNAVPRVHETYLAWQQLVGANNRQNRVPFTPFEEAAAYELAVKRLLQRAAREGYEAFSWTPAYMQTRRWDKKYEAGYIAAYDRQIKSAVEKIAKRFGAKVTGGTLPVTVDPDEQAENLFDSADYDLRFGNRTLEKILDDFDASAAHRQRVAAAMEDIRSRAGAEQQSQFDERLAEVDERIATFETYLAEEEEPLMRERFQRRLDAARAERADAETTFARHRDSDLVRVINNFILYDDGLRNALRDVAHDFVMRQPPATEDVWTVEINDAMRAALAEPFPLFQEKRGSIVLPRGDGQTAVLSIFAGADASTVIHEGAHHFLHVMETLVQSGEAPQRMADDWRALTDWWRSRAAEIAAEAGTDADHVIAYLDGMPMDHITGRAIWTALHEQTARGFEAYAAEGKAPTLGLRSAFEAFRAWLIAIYRTVVTDAALRVQLTDDVRLVFDHWLATDEQIAQATVTGGLDREAALKAGVPEGDLDALARLALEAQDEAKAYMLGLPGPRAAKRLEWRRQRAEALERARAELSADPAHQAVQWLSKRQWIGPEAQPEDLPEAGLNRQILTDIYGEDVVAELGAAVQDGGADHDDIAPFFGFESGDALVQAIRTTPDFARALRTRATAELRAAQGRPSADAVDAAMNGDKRGQQLDAEFRALRKAATGVPAFTRRQAAVIADQTIRAMPARAAIKAQDFLAAERRAGRKVEQALAKGDLAAAAKAKRDQLLQHSLYNASRRAMETVEKTRRRARRLQSAGTRKNLAGDYLPAIDQVLETYDFRRLPRGAELDRTRLAAFIARMEAEGRAAELAIPQHVRDEAKRRPYLTLTVAELEGVLNTLVNIEHTARLKNKLRTAQAERDLREAVDAVVAELDANMPDKPRGRIAGRKDRFVSGLRNYANIGLNVETRLRQYAGWTLGAAYDVIKRDIDRAGVVEQTMAYERDLKVEALYGMFSRQDRLNMGRKRSHPALGGSYSQWDLIAMALNMGNAENLDRLKGRDTGFPMSDQQIEYVKATLTQREWDFVEGVWELIDSYWPLIAARERRVTGVVPKKVEAEPFELDNGRLIRGGYYPIKYDGELSSAVSEEQLQEQLKMMQAGRFGKAQTRQGHLEARTGSGGRVLLLDVGVFHQHLADVIHDLAFAEVSANTWRVLRDGDLRAAFQRKGLQPDLDMLEIWVQDVAMGAMVGGGAPGRWAMMLKGNFTTSRLALNTATAYLQLTGFTHSIAAVGARDMAAGLGQFLGNPRGSWMSVLAQSEFMRHKLRLFHPDVAEMRMQTNTDPVSAGADTFTQRFIRYGLLPMQALQTLVDVPTWLGAQRKALRQGKSPAEAILLADRAVVRAQGGTAIADRTAFERGSFSRDVRYHGVLRLLATLASYMMTKGNLAREVVGRARTDGGVEAAATAAFHLFLLFTVEGMVRALSSGELDDDDDDDDVLPDPLRALLKETALSGAGTLPLVRDIAGYADGFGAGGGYGSIVETIGKPIKEISQGEMDKGLAKAVVNAIGLATGLPSGQINRIIDAAANSGEDDASFTDYLFGVKK